MKFKIKKAKIILYICLLLFIILTIGVMTNITEVLDTNMESFIIDIRNDKLTNIMKIITNIGGAYSLSVISILLFTLIKKKKTPIYIIINLVSVFLTSQIIKLILRRDRPSAIFLTYAHGFSYPSGHTMVSTAFFLFITYLITNKVKKKFTKILLYTCSLLLTTLIGFSRIYLGVHFLTDVIGGLLLGISYAIIFINIYISINEVKSWK